MSAVTKDLGPVTAYAYAVAGGYEGTEAEFTELIASLRDGQEMIAETFDSSKNYLIGEYCIYTGNLYRFTSNHSAGAWNSSHVSQVVLGDDVSDLMSALCTEEFNTSTIIAESSFNLFNRKTLIPNKGYRNTGEIVDSTEASITPLIPIASAATRVRANQTIAKTLFFDETKAVLSTEGNSYAANIPNGAKYFACSILNTVDFDALMIAYTNDTLGRYTDTTWGDMFSTLGYMPYGKMLPIASDRVDEYEIFTNLAGVTGVTISADTYTGNRYISISGSSTNTWLSLLKPCKECENYVFEFRGKSSAPDYSSNYTTGAFFCLEFYDANDAIIGGKYNAYILGVNKRGYHRYGYIAPRGAKTMKFRLVLRGTTSVELEGVKVNRLQNAQPRQKSGIVLDGHLGVTTIAPKNTIIGFELAGRAGFGAIVTNVKATSDNVLVCLHDATINATSDGTGNVSDYTFAQLQSYDFGSWFNAAYTGTKIPKFETALQTIAAFGARLVVSLHGNLTSAQLDDMCAIIKKAGFYNNCTVKSESMNELNYVFSVLGDNADYVVGASNGLLTTAMVDWILTFQGKMRFEFGRVDPANIDTSAIAYAVSEGVELSGFSAEDVSLMRNMYLLGITRFTADTWGDIVIPFE